MKCWSRGEELAEEEEYDVGKADQPRTLYVQRRLLNAGAVRAWAREQGFASALPAGEMHVTVAYSKEPVDWSAVEPEEDAIVVAGGGVERR